ncbi:MAG: hypothetical protein ACLVBX_05235 [Faecalibacterium prausnitzii]
MLTDDCFNGIALQFQAYPKLFHRGQKLMNVMPPLSPTALPAASICPWCWASRSSSSPTWTRPSWAVWC